MRKRELIYMLPFSLNMSIFSIGIQYSSVIMAGILYSLGPILTALFAHVLLKEKFGKEHFFGLLFALFGVLLLLKGSIETQSVLSFGTPIGNILILVAVCFWSLYPVAGRNLSKSYESSTITFYNFTTAVFLLLLLSPFEWIIRPVYLPDVSLSTLIAIIGAGVFGSALAYFCWQSLIKHTTAFVSSFLQYTGVITSILYGMFFFGEQLTTQFFIGTIFVLLGVFLATTYTQLKKRI